MENVVVTGIGQDGYYLSVKLLEKGYRVVGVDQWQHKGYSKDFKRLMSNKNFKLIEGDITDRYLMSKIIKEYKPKYFFNTAAISHVAVSFDIPERVFNVNMIAPLVILEELRHNSPDTKFLQCSTSEQFGDFEETPQTEETKMMPNSPYAIAKMSTFFLVKLYRKYGLKTYNTIAFNHESEIRPDNFVTRKITKTLAEIVSNNAKVLTLGNLNAKRDWGYAPDFVDGMIKIIESDEPDDYVLATGETHTVREFVVAAANAMGLDVEWTGTGVNEKGSLIATDINGENKVIIKENAIVVSKDFYRPTEVNVLLGDPSKIKEKLGWEPTTKFTELVAKMVRNDILSMEEKK